MVGGRIFELYRATQGTLNPHHPRDDVLTTTPEQVALLMPDPETLKIVLGGVGTILTSYLAYRLGVRRQKPAEKAAEVAEAKNAVEGWAELAAEHQREFARLGRELSELRTEVNGLRRKVIDLEQERDQHRFWRQIGVEYIKALLAVLIEHRIPAPPAPPGLRLDG